MRAVPLLALAACLDQTPYQGPVLDILTGTDGAGPIAVDGQALYTMTAASCGNDDCTGVRIAKCAKTGCDRAVALFTDASDDHLWQGSIALDDTHVYWNRGGIRRVAKSGGAAELIDGSTDACGLAVDAEALFYTTGCTQGPVDRPRFSVVRVPKSGGAAVELASSQGELSRQIAVDSRYAYWLSGGSLTRRRKDAMEPAESVGDQHAKTDGGWEGALAVRGGVAYWSGANGIFRTPVDGELAKAPSERLSSDTGVGVLAPDERDLYWLVNSTSDGEPPATCTVCRAPLGGGDAETVHEGDYMQGLAVDASFVFWSEGDTVSAMRK